jgi:uncharacterized protein
MKILLFSDVHGDVRALERIVATPADLYIAAGDLATFGKGLERCGPALQPLGGKLWVLPGNHETHEASRAFCQQHGFVDFHRQVKPLGATHWAGLGYSNITPFRTPGEYTEDEIGRALAAFEGPKPLYLVVHFPPHATTLDEFAPGKHAGSSTLREWVERVQPAYLFCGHIHEAAGLSERLGATPCVSLGKQGYLFEL